MNKLSENYINYVESKDNLSKLFDIEKLNDFYYHMFFDEFVYRGNGNYRTISSSIFENLIYLYLYFHKNNINHDLQLKYNSCINNLNNVIKTEELHKKNYKYYKKKIFDNLKKNNECLINGGWSIKKSKNGEGHAIALYIEKEKDKKYFSLCIINSGNGIDQHSKILNNDEKKQKIEINESRLADIIIKIENITYQDLIKIIIVNKQINFLEKDTYQKKIDDLVKKYIGDIPSKKLIKYLLDNDEVKNIEELKDIHNIKKSKDKKIKIIKKRFNKYFYSDYNYQIFFKNNDNDYNFSFIKKLESMAYDLSKYKDTTKSELKELEELEELKKKLKKLSETLSKTLLEYQKFIKEHFFEKSTIKYDNNKKGDILKDYLYKNIINIFSKNKKESILIDKVQFSGSCT
jgi:hypothetical protein